MSFIRYLMRCDPHIHTPHRHLTSLAFSPYHYTNTMISSSHSCMAYTTSRKLAKKRQRKDTMKRMTRQPPYAKRDSEPAVQTTQQKSDVDDMSISSDQFRNCRLFVSNIPRNVDWKVLKDHFRQVGDIVFASISKDMETGESKGCGLVQFASVDDAARCLEVMNGSDLEGSKLYVRKDMQERKGSGGSVKSKVIYKSKKPKMDKK